MWGIAGVHSVWYKEWMIELLATIFVGFFIVLFIVGFVAELALPSSAKQEKDFSTH